MTETDCSICTEKLGTAVTCAKCAGSSCRKCFQSYLLNSTLTPTCMHCRYSLSDDFVIDNTALSWRTKTYKKYREQLLYDSERARFPESQVNAEIYLNAKRISEPLVEELACAKPRLKELRLLIKEHDLPNRGEIVGSKKERASIKRGYTFERRTLIRRIAELEHTCATYNTAIVTYGWTNDGIVEKVKRTFVKACPTTGCNGFLNEEFLCGLCSALVCKSCHEIKIDTHECNEDTVASVKALKAEARPCPSCATLISKIDGCDQMWCTQCKTTFSWRTGLRESGNTHNPHYYEWMRLNGGLPRAPGDIVGCGFPRWADVLAMEKDSKYVNRLAWYHRKVSHFQGVVNRDVGPIDNYSCRIQLLAKEITEEKFKTLIQRKDKAWRKSTAKKQIYDMTYVAAGDIFRNCLAGTSFKEACLSLEALFKYSNKSFERIAVGYDCKIVQYPFYDKIQLW